MTPVLFIYFGAGGGIRTHEPLQDRLLKPTPLTRLGDPCLLLLYFELIRVDKYMLFKRRFFVCLDVCITKKRLLSSFGYSMVG